MGGADRYFNELTNVWFREFGQENESTDTNASVYVCVHSHVHSFLLFLGTDITNNLGCVRYKEIMQS